MLKKLVFLALVASTLAVQPALAKRAVIFRDPKFSDTKPLEHGATFIVWDHVDIRSMVQDFILAFDGDYAAGEAYARGALVDCLTGKHSLGTAGSSSLTGTPIRLNLVDLPAAVPNNDVRGDLAVTVDSAGVANLSVSRPDSLGVALAAVHADFLIVIRGLHAVIDESTTPAIMFPSPHGSMFSGGGKQRAIELDAQVLVLRADSLAVVWNGFVTGRHGIGKFRKSSADGVAAAFALDLQEALR